MKTWTLSRYTAVINGMDGDVLLHNSFMGAIARIPGKDVKKVAKYFSRQSSEIHGPSQYKLPQLENAGNAIITEADLADPLIKELCDGGFFMPDDFDEEKILQQIIAKERDKSLFHMVIMPHENCNFRCVYCYETFERGKMKPHIISGLEKFAGQVIDDYDGLVISWFGGEPLLARDVIYRLSDTFMDICSVNNKNYFSNMTTNGYFLQEKVVDELFKRKINQFQVTLDGGAESHNQLRKLAGGGATHERIVQNLINMHKRDDDFKVRVRVNYNLDVLENIDNFLADLQKYFEKDPRFDISFNPIERWGGPNDDKLNVCESSKIHEYRNALLKKADAWGYNNAITRKSISSHGSVCYAGKTSSIVVGSDGKIYKCTVAFQDPLNNVGFINEEGQLLLDEEKWKLWTGLSDKNSTKCGTCTFNPACQSRACPLIAIKDKTPPCPTEPESYRSLVNLLAYTAKNTSSHHT